MAKRKKPARSGESSKRMSAVAARFLGMNLEEFLKWYNSASPEVVFLTIKSLAGNVVGQAPDRKKPVRVVSISEDISKPFTDVGFDPRDGGKVGHEHKPFVIGPGIVSYSVYSPKTGKGESGVGRMTVAKARKTLRKQRRKG